ncbi:hypothetical protein RR46_09223 [Papilio xuthus]|uniref:Secreted protein n=1 Tax=Papilio xuthus TaxID=66420 RepID=A0A194PV91_PAPXU|nr:hypothetical protein RR46_09223 [Papilio xuthus]
MMSTRAQLKALVMLALTRLSFACLKATEAFPSSSKPSVCESRRIGCGPRGATVVSRDGTARCRRRYTRLAEEQLARAGEGTCSVLDRTLPEGVHRRDIGVVKSPPVDAEEPLSSRVAGAMSGL